MDNKQPMSPSMPFCNQCNMYHPPIPSGQRCPNATIKANDGSDIDFNSLFVPLKTICISQIEKRKIKNYKKMFGFMIVKLTEMMEKYEE